VRLAVCSIERSRRRQLHSISLTLTCPPTSGPRTSHASPIPPGRGVPDVPLCSAAELHGASRSGAMFCARWAGLSLGRCWRKTPIAASSTSSLSGVSPAPLGVLSCARSGDTARQPCRVAKLDGRAAAPPRFENGRERRNKTDPWHAGSASRDTKRFWLGGNALLASIPECLLTALQGEWSPRLAARVLG
jgi:hypothetical protein